MQHVFGDHIGRTVEAYVDDIVVKTRKADDLVNDLRVAFDCLQANGVKLNPEKCVFRVPRGMLLGYIVSQRGIEPNPSPTLRRSQPSSGWARFETLRGSRRCWGASPP
jgi:hypothetical protein